MPRRSKLWLLLLLLLIPLFLRAQTAEELQAQIDQRSKQIKEIEKEIAQYQLSLAATTKQSNTLSGEISIINTTIKKLNADIKLTETKIENSQQTIQKLQLDIGNKDSSIEDNKISLAESLRLLAQEKDDNLLERVASEGSFSDFWVNQEKINRLEEGIHDQMAILRNLRADLVDKKTATEAEEKKLFALKSQLADQKKIANSNYKAKDELLKQTKNQEAGYKQLLANRQAKKAAFEKELFNFESQLNIKFNLSELPNGKGILRWPLDEIRVTQYFGKTVDAKRLYTSGTHSGVDFGTAIGTPVRAAQSGIIKGTGNTDTICPGASYGNWILIEHNNGLSTLYGHLSLIKVSASQKVNVGEVIGYSGNTGYSTGPHLHFTVLASEGTKIMGVPSKVCKGTYTMPVADPKAYLDPMVYL
jgi:murein DD-endopeptidase MepM/ murein hydrolase activator NlpD